MTATDSRNCFSYETPVSPFEYNSVLPTLKLNNFWQLHHFYSVGFGTDHRLSAPLQSR